MASLPHQLLPCWLLTGSQALLCSQESIKVLEVFNSTKPRGFSLLSFSPIFSWDFYVFSVTQQKIKEGTGYLSLQNTLEKIWKQRWLMDSVLQTQGTTLFRHRTQILKVAWTPKMQSEPLPPSHSFFLPPPVTPMPIQSLTIYFLLQGASFKISP